MDGDQDKGAGSGAAPARPRSFLWLLAGVFAGAGMSWGLYDFQSPSGLLILLFGALGVLLAEGAGVDAEAPDDEGMIRFETKPPWPNVQKVSALMFLLCVLAGAALYSPKVIDEEALRSALLVFFAGLGLLAGSVNLLCLKGPLRKLSILALIMALALMTIGGMALAGAKPPAAPALIGLAMICVIGLKLAINWLAGIGVDGED